MIFIGNDCLLGIEFVDEELDLASAALEQTVNILPKIQK